MPIKSIKLVPAVHSRHWAPLLTLAGVIAILIALQTSAQATAALPAANAAPL